MRFPLWSQAGYTPAPYPYRRRYETKCEPKKGQDNVLEQGGTTMKPVKTYRAGAISAKIWENQSVKADGSVAVFHTVSLDRSYQDKDGSWKSATSFRIADLPKAELVLRKVYEFLVLKRDEQNPTMSPLAAAGGIAAIA